MLRHRQEQPPQLLRGGLGLRTEPALECLPEAFTNDVIQQRILVGKMGVEGGPVDRGTPGNVLNRNIVKTLLGLQAHEGLDQQLAGSHRPRVNFLDARHHVCLGCQQARSRSSRISIHDGCCVINRYCRERRRVKTGRHTGHLYARLRRTSGSGPRRRPQLIAGGVGVALHFSNEVRSIKLSNGQRTRPRVSRLTIPSRMTAPTNDTSSAVVFRALLLMVGPPSKNPPIIAPTIPTTIFNSAPCCASVRITMLANQPISAPTSNQTIRLIMVAPPCLVVMPVGIATRFYYANCVPRFYGHRSC